MTPSINKNSPRRAPTDRLVAGEGQGVKSTCSPLPLGEGQGVRAVSGYPRISKLLLGVLLLPCLLSAGCGPKELPAKRLHGAVTCGGQTVPSGQLVFMPIEGTPGANTAALIVNGQYSVTSRGGVSLGKHRVSVDARKKTGRQVQGHNGREAAMVDEEVCMGPAAYAGNQSPLVVEITPDFDEQYNIVLPGP
jgi:hypothetical protein